MASIIEGAAVSHTPTIGFAYDTNKQNDPAWAPVFKSFEPVREWFKEEQHARIKGIRSFHINAAASSFFIHS